MTGGAGFIGANLVRVLLSSGCHVTVLDDLSAGCLAYLKGLPIEFIQGDVLDKDLVVDAVLSHDWIVSILTSPFSDSWSQSFCKKPFISSAID